MCLSVCVSVCEHDISNTLHPIFMKLGIQVHMVNSKNPIDFGPNRFSGNGVTVNLPLRAF